MLSTCKLIKKHLDQSDVNKSVSMICWTTYHLQDTWSVKTYANNHSIRVVRRQIMTPLLLLKAGQ